MILGGKKETIVFKTIALENDSCHYVRFQKWKNALWYENDHCGMKTIAFKKRQIKPMPSPMNAISKLPPCKDGYSRSTTRGSLKTFV